MIKGIIFDLDGVLAFTDKYHYKAWKKIADEENIYFDEIINNQLRGISRMDSLNIILKNAKKKYSDEEKEALAYKKNEIYKESLSELQPSDITNDVRNTLVALREKGIKLAIASSSKNTMSIITKTDLIKYFDAVVDGNQISKSKPDPEVFLKAAEKLNLSPNECLIVEDAIPGINAGIAGGFKTIGINDASHYNKATYKIDNIKEVLKCLED